MDTGIPVSPRYNGQESYGRVEICPEALQGVISDYSSILFDLSRLTAEFPDRLSLRPISKGVSSHRVYSFPVTPPISPRIHSCPKVSSLGDVAIGTEQAPIDDRESYFSQCGDTSPNGKNSPTAKNRTRGLTSEVITNSESVALSTGSLADIRRAGKKSGILIRGLSKPKLRRNYTGDDPDVNSRFAVLRWFEAAAGKDMFELVFGVLIILNTCAMCFEAQYLGHDSAYRVEVAGSRQASDAWPGAGTIFRVMDISFGIFFTCEVIIKVVALRQKFIRSWWNLFDSFIVASWFLYALDDFLPMNPFFLRLLRLARLTRLLRLAKTIQVFDTLHLMAASLTASVYVLFWSVILLLGIMIIIALVMVNVIEVYIDDTRILLSNRQEAYNYFGNFSRSLLSVFELTFGNFTPITRFLHENVSEYFGTIIMLYYSIVSFAVVMVIRGVFLHETFQVAEENDELMILKQRRVNTKVRSKMTAFLCEADTDFDGYLNREEFIKIMIDPRVNSWLAALGLEVRHVENMFEIIADSKDRVSSEEFIHAFTRLRGPAKSIDMVQVLRLSRAINAFVQDIGDAVGIEKWKSDEPASIESFASDMGIRASQ